jgi:hypothetical protein
MGVAFHECKINGVEADILAVLAQNLTGHFDLQIWSFLAGAQVGLAHGELSLHGVGVLHRF